MEIERENTKAYRCRAERKFSVAIATSAAAATIKATAR
jgi:hypothetical protein